MSEWRTSTWGDEISLEYGKALRGYENSQGKYRVFGSNGPIGWTDKPLANGPGIILGRKGAYRGVQYSESDFYVIDTAYYVVPKTDLDMRWLFYAIQFHKLGEIDDGSPIPSTTRAAVYVRDLEVPPITIQREIARILGSIDDNIELNRQINQTLEQMAQAIFKSWFVDFDPVRIRIGNLPDRPFLTPEILALFPDELVDSELGEIPKGWEVSAIGDEVKVCGGGTPSTTNPDFWDGDFAWITPKDLSRQSDKVQIDSERTISAAGVKKISSGQLPIGTVLLSSRAPIGYLSLTMIPVSINQGFIAMICNKRLPNTYVLQWTTANLDAIKQRGSGTTFAEISKANFRQMRVLVPSEEVLTAFQNTVEPFYAEISVKVRESRTLATFRDTLLPKLLSGALAMDEAKEGMTC